MTEEMNQAEAPVSDAPSPSEPVTSEPTSDAQMEAEMAQAFDKANPEESGEWRRPPEWKPGPSESEPADLEAQEQVQQTSAIQPPVSLNKEAREHWASLPEFSEAIHRPA